MSDKIVRILPGEPLTRQQIWEMKRLWRTVPHVQCKGLCQAACTNVPLPPIEAYYLIQKHNATIVPAGHGSDLRMIMPTLGVNGPCQFLKAGKCSIYEDRPLVCREYGHDVLTLQCEHGCTASVPLTEELALSLMVSLVYILDMTKYAPDGYAKILFTRMLEQVGDMILEIETA